jgi:hypothetical protein
MSTQYEITLDSDGLTSVQEIGVFKNNEQTSEMNRRTVDDIYEEYYSNEQPTRDVFIAELVEEGLQLESLFGDLDKYEDEELLQMISLNKSLPDFNKWRTV